MVTEGQKTCAACGVHAQQCTYVEDPQPRKRRIDNSGNQEEHAQKRFAYPTIHVDRKLTMLCFRSAVSPASDGSSAMAVATPSTEANVTQDYRHSLDPSLRLGSSSYQYGTHIWPTTEVEPLLLGLLPDQGLLPTTKAYQLRGSTPFCVDGAIIEGLKIPNLSALGTVERSVGPHGPKLLTLYQEKVGSNFPVIQESFFLEHQAGGKQNLDPALLASIYTLAIPWLVREDVVSTMTPDLATLEKLAFSLFTRALHTPTLSTIQAGILLMQRPDVVSKTLNAQLVDAAFELGLQVDCSSWSLSPAEKGLRKRLAWALYLQDKWCSLIHGRPSAIPSNNWAVPKLRDEDFEVEAIPITENLESTGSASIFKQMVSLSEMLSTVLDTFYTLKAMQEVEDAAQAGTRLILDRAKPVQMKLKEWFGSLPSSLKMDATTPDKLSFTGIYFQSPI